MSIRKTAVSIYKYAKKSCYELIRGVFATFLFSRKNECALRSVSQVNVAFIIQRTELYNSIKTVVDSLVENNCDVTFIPIPRHIIGLKTFDLESYDRVLEFCKNLHVGTVLPGYNQTTREYVDILDQYFDYIFLNVPYCDQYPATISPDKLSQHSKLCYVSYGYTLLKKHLVDIYHSRSFAKNISFIFASNDLEYSYGQRYLKLSELFGRKKLYNVGFPRFDLIKTENIMTNTVLWLPRYTTNIGVQAENEQSSFLMFYRLFLNFAEEHLDYHFVIRPHPLMFDNFIAKGVMSCNEVADFKLQIRESSNVELDESPDYLEAFNESSILLSDYSSTVAEFYVSGKPIVYFGSKKDFSIYDSEMYDTFYDIETWEDAKAYLVDLMNGFDPKKRLREDCINKFVLNKPMDAGKAIVDVILNDYNKNKK